MVPLLCLFLLLPLDRPKDLFTLPILALILEVLLEEAFHIAIRAVLDFVEQSRVKYFPSLFAALK
jgi:hypothetical protein